MIGGRGTCSRIEFQSPRHMQTATTHTAHLSDIDRDGIHATGERIAHGHRVQPHALRESKSIDCEGYCDKTGRRVDIKTVGGINSSPRVVCDSKVGGVRCPDASNDRAVGAELHCTEGIGSNDWGKRNLVNSDGYGAVCCC